MGASEGYIRHVHEGPGGVEGSPGGRRASAEGLFLGGAKCLGGTGVALASLRKEYLTVLRRCCYDISTMPNSRRGSMRTPALLREFHNGERGVLFSTMNDGRYNVPIYARSKDSWLSILRRHTNLSLAGFELHPETIGSSLGLGCPRRGVSLQSFVCTAYSRARQQRSWLK